MKRFSFGLPVLLLAVPLIALPVRFWPPFEHHLTYYGPEVHFHKPFWQAIGVESTVLGALLLARLADAARRPPDDSPPHDE